MKLSTKGRYAVTAIMAVALDDSSKPVTLAQISEEQGISISYLEQIFAKLRKHALVKGTRGPGGGYTLARDSSQIRVADVITAVEDQERVQKPVGNGVHSDRNNQINSMWTELSAAIQDRLNQISLADLMRRTSSAADLPHAARVKGNNNRASWA